MQTVKSIIETVYGDHATAAERLGVTSTAVFNWKAWGYFPARLVVPIFEHAREKGVEFDVSEIPTQTNAKAAV